MINYSDITFVIPSLQKDCITLQSIPDECKVIVRSDATRGLARSEGAKLATTKYIIFADSDITFTTQFLDYAMSLIKDNTIVGLQGFYPSPFLISRFMCFTHAAYEDIGPLLDIQHGEETEWCIRALEKGYRLVGVPRESVYHHPHPRSVYKKEWKNLFNLIRLHPTFPVIILKTVFMKMKYSDYGEDMQI